MALRNIRHIVRAVQNPNAQVRTNAFTRLAPKLDFAKANQRWWIHVEFNSDIDLYIFEKTLSASEIRLVELQETFYVEDPRIPDTADMGNADRLADTFIAQLNGATRILCPHFNGVRKTSIVELLENGTGRGIVGFDLAILGEAELPAVRGFLNGESSPIGAFLPALRSSKDVQEALFYLGAEGNPWANLYKACAVVEEHTGGEKALLTKGLCSRSARERFRRTANHQEAIGRFSRHARSRIEPPPDPMTIAQARLFAGELVKNWIASLVA